MDVSVFKATEESVLTAYRSGHLTSLIFSYKTARTEHFKEICVALHNREIIDLLSLTETQVFAALGLHEFFAGQHFYNDCIPQLVAPVSDMMRCVRTLVVKAGADGAANIPYTAFSKWCLGDLDRAAQVVSKARNNDTLAENFLTIALTAGLYRSEAQQFANDYTDERQLSGISALGRMSYDSKPVAVEALEILLKVTKAFGGERLQATTMLASLDIGSKASLLETRQVIDIVRLACDNSGESIPSTCATALLHHSQVIPREIAEIILHTLIKLNPKSSEALNLLDLSLGQSLDGNIADLTLDFLMKYLVQNEDEVSLSTFHHLKSALSSKDDQLRRVIVQWILSGEHILCESVAELLRSREGTPIEIGANELALNPMQLEFFCQKLVGYLFMQPVILCSILVSVLRSCDALTSQKITRLLFDPILRNYGGQTRDYLSGIAPDDPAYPHVAPALERAREYIATISSVGRIKELHPSDTELQTVYSRDFDEMQKARADAMKQSVLLNLVTRSTILHGRKTMTYVTQPGEERKPIEMELHSHSFEIEMPRMNVYDPVGLDFELLIYRLLRAKS